MISHGFIWNKFESCVYSKELSPNSYIYFSLYVDDMLIATKDMVDTKALNTILKNEFEMKDLGAAKKILGMEIRRDRRVG